MNCQDEEAGGKNTPRGDTDFGKASLFLLFQVLIAKSSLFDSLSQRSKMLQPQHKFLGIL